MQAIEALTVLTELSRGQWGMLTAAQAAARGVPRPVLARLARQGRLERLVHGVYRDAGTPGSERDALRAAWLAIQPAATAEDRLGEPTAGPVVCGATAAWLYGLGTLQPEPYEFSSPARLQTRRADVVFHRRRLDADATTVADGLPTTTVAQTVADLLAWHTDESLVASVVADAVSAGLLDPSETAARLAPLAARNGLPSGDGTALLDRLLRVGGLDPASVAERIARGPLGALVAAVYVARTLSPDSADWSAAPSVEHLSAQLSVADAQEATRAAVRLAPLLAAVEELLLHSEPDAHLAAGDRR